MLLWLIGVSLEEKEKRWEPGGLRLAGYRCAGATGSLRARACPINPRITLGLTDWSASAQALTVELTNAGMITGLHFNLPLLVLL